VTPEALDSALQLTGASAAPSTRKALTCSTFVLSQNRLPRTGVSRGPLGTAAAYGEDLPKHGAATETRTIADLENKIRDLIVLRTDADLRMPYEEAARSFELEWDYTGLPAKAADALMENQASKSALEDAQTRNAERVRACGRNTRLRARHRPTDGHLLSAGSAAPISYASSCGSAVNCIPLIGSKIVCTWFLSEVMRSLTMNSFVLRLCRHASRYDMGTAATEPLIPRPEVPRCTSSG
jgi:hypothetical protein